MLPIPAHFVNDGAPLPGLTPVISILELATGIPVVTNIPMTEVGLGFYRYDFLTWDPTKDYCYLIDGGAALQNYQRYRVGTTGVAGAVQQVLVDTGVLRDVEQGSWELSAATNQMIFYDRAGAELMRFNLFRQDGTPGVKAVFSRVLVAA